MSLAVCSISPLSTPCVRALSYMWFTSLQPQSGAPKGARATTRKRSLSACSLEADDDEGRVPWGFHDRVVGVASTGAVGVEVVVESPKTD